MQTEWKEAERIKVGRIVNNYESRARVTTDQCGNVIVIVEKKVPVEHDITEVCTVELVQSRHSSGFYCLIKNGDKRVAALGIDTSCASRVNPGYRLQKADGAVISFRVIKTK